MIGSLNTDHWEDGNTVMPTRREEDTIPRCSSARMVSRATVREIEKDSHSVCRVNFSPDLILPLTMSEPI